MDEGVICILTLEDYKNFDINFTISPVLEYLHAIYAVAEEDYLVKTCKELNLSHQDSIVEVLSTMRNSLSKFLKNELSYFFDPYDYGDGGIGFISFWTVFLRNSSVKTVTEMFSILEKTNENLLLSYVVSLIVSKYENKPVDELCSWDEVKYDSNELVLLISKANIENVDFKERLMECLNNPIETKERLILMFRQFYEKAYKPIEEITLNKLRTFSLKYEKLFNENPEKFTKQFLSTSLKSLTVKEHIHVSYFMHLGCSSWSSTSIKEDWYVLGAYTHTFNSDTISKDQILLFYKTLSDEKRLTIIKLLSNRPWYVYELADQLKMSAATISYHLSMLQPLGIIEYERSDHRIYYSLDKKKLNELSEKAMKSLLSK